jgi:hypothetical protein
MRVSWLRICDLVCTSASYTSTMLALSSSRNDIIFETTTPCDDICHSPSIKWSISTTAIAVFGDPVIDQIIIPCFILPGCGITYRSIRRTPKLKLNEA